MQPRLPIRWFLLLATCAGVFVAAATLGAPVPLSDLWSPDSTRAGVARAIFLWTEDGWGLRPVRLLAGLLVGATLATSGAALQVVFRNPLAEPYLLGISAGGALGATLAAAFNFPTLAGFEPSTLMAFLGSLAASGLIYQLGQVRALQTRGGHGFDRSTLLLTGVAISAFLGALMSLVVALSNRADLAQRTMFWLLGSLTRATPAQNMALALSLAIGLVVLLASARDLNAMQVGDEEALSLGVPIQSVHRRLLLVAALMSSAAVAASGLIGFVGLLAPHLVRLLFGNNPRVVMPATAIGGATLLLACDAIARSAAAEIEIPVGIITALLGVPLFLLLALRSR